MQLSWEAPDPLFGVGKEGLPDVLLWESASASQRLTMGMGWEPAGAICSSSNSGSHELLPGNVCQEPRLWLSTLMSDRVDLRMSLWETCFCIEGDIFTTGKSPSGKYAFNGFMVP